MRGKRNIKNSEVILGEKILLSLHSRRIIKNASNTEGKLEGLKSRQV